VRLAPKSPEGHNSLGWVLLAQGEIDSAIVHFRSAVKLSPDFALAHMNFSSALVRKGDVLAALREAKEAVRLAPGDSETHHTLARALDFSGDLDGAIGEFRRAIELEPQRAELHDDLGTVLVQKSDAQGAAAEFSEALRLQPNLRQRIFISAFCVTGKITRRGRATSSNCNTTKFRGPGRPLLFGASSKEQGRNGCGDQRATSLCCIEARLLRRAKQPGPVCSSIAAKLTKPSKHFARP